MIVGQSAGANSVSQHLVRPKSWGLFSSAGLESGAFYDGLDTPTVASQEGHWNALAAELQCDKAPGGPVAVAECLSRVDAVALLKASWKNGSDGVWTPTVDGVDLTAPGPVLAKAGKLAKVPIFAGSVSEDINTLPMDATCTRTNCTEALFLSSMTGAGFLPSEASELLGLYSKDSPRPTTQGDSKYYWGLQHAGADFWAGCPARRIVRWYADLGVPSYWYRWSYVPAGPNGHALAHHAVEQPFIFHVLSETEEEEREDGGNYHLAAAEEVPFSAMLVRSWAAMAASGSPATSEVPWERFNASAKGSALLIAGGAGEHSFFATAHDYMSAKCDLFDRLFWRKMP